MISCPTYWIWLMNTPNILRAISRLFLRKKDESTWRWLDCGNRRLTKEVASQARVNVNKCSAQLKRLVDRGAVSMEDGAKRRRTYYVAERMYNIYYLLRRPGADSQMVEALVRFMGSYYSPGEIVHILALGLPRACTKMIRG